MNSKGSKNSFKGLSSWLLGVSIVRASREVCENEEHPYVRISIRAEEGDGYIITVPINPNAKHGSKHHKCHCEICGVCIEGAVCHILGEVTAEQVLGVRGAFHLSGTRTTGPSKGEVHSFSIRATVDKAILRKPGISYEYRKHLLAEQTEKKPAANSSGAPYPPPTKKHLSGAGIVHIGRRNKILRNIAAKASAPAAPVKPHLTVVK